MTSAEQLIFLLQIISFYVLVDKARTTLEPTNFQPTPSGAAAVLQYRKGRDRKKRDRGVDINRLQYLNIYSLAPCSKFSATHRSWHCFFLIRNSQARSMI